MELILKKNKPLIENYEDLKNRKLLKFTDKWERYFHMKILNDFHGNVFRRRRRSNIGLKK